MASFPLRARGALPARRAGSGSPLRRTVVAAAAPRAPTAPLSSPSTSVEGKSPRRCRSHRLSVGRAMPPGVAARASSSPSPKPPAEELPEGASADVRVIAARAWKLAKPYWTDKETARSARWKLATVVGLTLGTTGVSVLFNFLGRDFFNALSEKDAARFTAMLFKWLAAIGAGVPVFVLRDWLQSRLALDWRRYLTEKLTDEYLSGRAFYRVAAQGTVDNPDQRIAADVGQFTDAALGLLLTLLAALVDLVSFSGILYSIYPPLFVALILYSVGGTAVSLYLGKALVPLNFKQEAAEADLRYALVRLRENAESVAFYGGEEREKRTLRQRLAAAVANGIDLLATSRNLAFFTSMYRYVIQILPAAVVAPLYFKGSIELGVINQSASAFNHVLSDVSLVVYQLESLAGFSAVVDRLGEFVEAVEDAGGLGAEAAGGGIELSSVPLAAASDKPLLEMRDVTLYPPYSRGRPGARPLVAGLSLSVRPGDSLLIVGPSGAGKTSILRAAAGLWTTGEGEIVRVGSDGVASTTAGSSPAVGGNGASASSKSGKSNRDVFFVPQKPYVVLGSLRDQLLYPAWVADDGQGETRGERPSDEDLASVLRRVNLGKLLDRGDDTSGRISGSGLDATADWASMLSLGEQQRLAIARVLLARPALVLMDESTSALDVGNEALAYQLLKEAGVAVVSVGHRPSLTSFHSRVLRLSPSASSESTASTSEWEVVELGEGGASPSAGDAAAALFAGGRR